MKFSNTTVIDGVATIRIYQHLGCMGGDYGVNGSQIADTIDYLNGYDDISKINIRINSVGGDVNDGLSIVSAILTSKIPVDTYIDGMAYSMAGVIAMCGKKRYMADYGTFMMHSAQGNADEEILNMITESLAKIFEATTPFSIDKCRELMAIETWLNADQCKEMGIVDEIVVTNNKIENINSLILEGSKKELMSVYNSLLTGKKSMNKLIKFLNLDNSVTEDDIIAKVKDQLVVEAEKNEALKKQNEELESKIAVYENAEKEKEAKEIEQVIDSAISEGKILADSKDKFINLGLKKAELMDLFGGIKKAQDRVSIIDAVIKPVANDRAGWTFSDWEKKDPEGLKEIRINNKSEYDRLIATIKNGKI